MHNTVWCEARIIRYQMVIPAPIANTDALCMRSDFIVVSYPFGTIMLLLDLNPCLKNFVSGIFLFYQNVTSFCPKPISSIPTLLTEQTLFLQYHEAACFHCLSDLRILGINLCPCSSIMLEISTFKNGI